MAYYVAAPVGGKLNIDWIISTTHIPFLSSLHPCHLPGAFQRELLHISIEHIITNGLACLTQQLHLASALDSAETEMTLLLFLAAHFQHPLCLGVIVICPWHVLTLCLWANTRQRILYGKHDICESWHGMSQWHPVASGKILLQHHITKYCNIIFWKMSYYIS